MQKLISSIFDKHRGKPILVIAGGRSVLQDLPALPKDYFSAVISANDHGFRQQHFKIDYAVSVDKTHLERHMPMREFMRAFCKPGGVPMINRHSWADLRLGDWDLVTNSGLTATVVASVLGGHPVVTTGIDMWSEGGVYFHGVKQNHRSPPSKVGITQKMRELRHWARGTVLRSPQGPVAEAFGGFDPEESLAEIVPHHYLAAVGPPVYCEATADFDFSPADPVAKGQVLCLTSHEFKKLRTRHGLRRLDTESEIDLTCCTDEPSRALGVGQVSSPAERPPTGSSPR